MIVIMAARLYVLEKACVVIGDHVICHWWLFRDTVMIEAHYSGKQSCPACNKNRIGPLDSVGSSQKQVQFVDSTQKILHIIHLYSDLEFWSWDDIFIYCKKGQEGFHAKTQDIFRIA